MGIDIEPAQTTRNLEDACCHPNQDRVLRPARPSDQFSHLCILTICCSAARRYAPSKVTGKLAPAGQMLKMQPLTRPGTHCHVYGPRLRRVCSPGDPAAGMCVSARCEDCLNALEHTSDDVKSLPSCVAVIDINAACTMACMPNGDDQNSAHELRASAKLGIC